MLKNRHSLVEVYINGEGFAVRLADEYLHEWLLREDDLMVIGEPLRIAGICCPHGDT